MTATSAWRGALRIARRDALRAKGRSTLVIAMIMLPVMMITALVVVLATENMTLAESLPTALGRADARIAGTAREPVVQDVDPDHAAKADGGELGDNPEPWRTDEVAATLGAVVGAGTRLLPISSDQIEYRTGVGYAHANGTEVDLRDPLTTGMVELVSGRFPRTGGEAVVSPAMAERGFTSGKVVTVGRDNRRLRVTGIVDDPRTDATAQTIIALPGAMLGARATPDWLVDTPRPVGWSEVQRLNRSGLTALSVAVVDSPPPPGAIPDAVRSLDPAGEDQETLLMVVALAVVMIVLEVVLLAGPAFAVGTRRQRHQLALVLAAGGNHEHVRSIVLAGGIVLGGIAAALGVLAGIGTAALVVPAARSAGSSFGPFEVPIAQVTIVAALGLGSGLLAAYVPARQAARMDVIAALAGRRGQVRSRVGWPILGGAVVAAGVAATLAATGVEWSSPDTGVISVAAGALLAIIGIVMATPWIVGQIGRMAVHLPLTLRLAARDAARNRGRTAPVVAAIMVAVAGLTALAIGFTSEAERRRLDYTPRGPQGTVFVESDNQPPEYWAAARANIERNLPGAHPIELRVPGGRPASCDDASCYIGVEMEGACAGCRPENMRSQYVTVATIAVGDARLLRFALGRSDPAATAALAQGKTIVFHPSTIKDGMATFATAPVGTPGSQPPAPTRIRVPAVVLDPPVPTGFEAIIPETAARRLGAPVRTTGYVVDPAEHTTTEAEEQRLQEAMAAQDNAEVYVERGYDAPVTATLLALAVAGAALTIGGAAIATGLAVADARPDLATLAAVGAAPRTRRLLSMGQAAVVAFLGVWLGIAAGIVPGIGVARPLTEPPGSAGGSGGSEAAPSIGPIVEIPWYVLGAMAVVVPLVAMLAAGAFTRSRLPRVRRVGG